MTGLSTIVGEPFFWRFGQVVQNVAASLQQPVVSPERVEWYLSAFTDSEWSTVHQFVRIDLEGDSVEHVKAYTVFLKFTFLLNGSNSVEAIELQDRLEGICRRAKSEVGVIGEELDSDNTITTVPSLGRSGFEIFTDLQERCSQLVGKVRVGGLVYPTAQVQSSLELLEQQLKAQHIQLNLLREDDLLRWLQLGDGNFLYDAVGLRLRPIPNFGFTCPYDQAQPNVYTSSEWLAQWESAMHYYPMAKARLGDRELSAEQWRELHEYIKDERENWATEKVRTWLQKAEGSFFELVNPFVIEQRAIRIPKECDVSLNFQPLKAIYTMLELNPNARQIRYLGRTWGGRCVDSLMKAYRRGKSCTWEEFLAYLNYKPEGANNKPVTWAAYQKRKVEDVDCEKLTHRLDKIVLVE